MSSVEDIFVTHDKASGDRDVTFKMIEDENGDIFWGYGHVPDDEFVTEVNRWLQHCDADFGLVPDDAKVEHLWVEMADDEHFRVVDPFGPEFHTSMVPVTRLML